LASSLAVRLLPACVASAAEGWLACCNDVQAHSSSERVAAQASLL
jgi:hypothetical protein